MYSVGDEVEAELIFAGHSYTAQVKILEVLSNSQYEVQTGQMVTIIHENSIIRLLDGGQSRKVDSYDYAMKGVI
jgi:hypothetical protein